MATSLDNLTLHRYICTNKGYTEVLGEGVELTLMLVPAGEFMMGASPNDSESRDNEHPQHRVQVPQFMMGRYPVTQAQWRVVARYDREEIDLEEKPSHFTGDDLPVEQVSWHEATEFCKRLSTKSKKNYHLPSEAQWEYACRAGTETVYHYGDKIATELANYSRVIGQTTVVGKYPPNRWGLYDMHGNVWEWCQDHWHGDYKGAPSDGSAWIEGIDSSRRILRGGSWNSSPRFCRSAYRFNDFPENRYDFFGFRVSCSAPRSLQ